MELRESIRQGRAQLPVVGKVRLSEGVPHFVVEVDGRPVEPIGAYLSELALADGSPLTPKSYAYELLRWWRSVARCLTLNRRCCTDSILSRSI
jgi:hypothetical protein